MYTYDGRSVIIIISTTEKSKMATSGMLVGRTATAAASRLSRSARTPLPRPEVSRGPAAASASSFHSLAASSAPRPDFGGPITSVDFGQDRRVAGICSTRRITSTTVSSSSCTDLASRMSLLGLPSSASSSLGSAFGNVNNTCTHSRLQLTRGFARKSTATTLTQAEMIARQEILEADVDDGEDGGPVVPRDRSNPIHTYSEDFGKMSNEELANSDTIPGWDLIHSPPRKLPRGALVGKVVSDKMQKTVSVAVDRYRMIPKLRIRRKYTRKFMAHDEEELCQMGDLVMIVPCQRLSKHKHFMVREIIRAKGVL